MGPTNNKIKVSIKIITYTYPKERKKRPIVITKKMIRQSLELKRKKKERECGQERVKRQLERKYYPG